MDSEVDRVEDIETPIQLTYHYKPGHSTERFLRALKEGRIVAQRCPKCENVIVPPRGSCARCGVATEEEVELLGRGCVLTFTVVHIPVPGSDIKPPFVNAHILLDGANIGLFHLVGEIDPSKVRIGMRVEAVWRPREEWDFSLENIRYFKPSDEPDVDVDALVSRSQGHA